MSLSHTLPCTFLTACVATVRVDVLVDYRRVRHQYDSVLLALVEE